MATFYSNNPSRFGTCYGSHDPTTGQYVAPAAVTEDAGVGNSRRRALAYIRARMAERGEKPSRKKERMLVYKVMKGLPLDDGPTVEDQNNAIIKIIMMGSL